MSESLQIHALFSSHAVFQHGQPLRVTGCGAAPGGLVEAELAGCRASATAAADGGWAIAFPPICAGGPHTLRVRCEARETASDDLWAGDVWLCAGQSNMQFAARQLKEWEALRAAEGDPLVRHFTVGEAIALEPRREVEGAWKPCAGEDAAVCSAVGYYFAQAVRRGSRAGHAIGLIVNALGDTDISAWMPREALEANPAFAAFVERIPQTLPATLRPQPYQDGPNRGEPLGWARCDFDDAAWPPMRLPGFWQLQGLQASGCVWFRRGVEIPPEWEGRDLVLELGALDDYDVTYFNGVEVGRTGAETPNSYVFPRVYRVPASLVRTGRAVIALRIFDYTSLGGVSARDDQMKVYPAGEPGTALPLGGSWRHGVEQTYPWLCSGSPLPTLLFNAMVHPLAGFPLRGVLWYQGENDSIRATLYRTLLPGMVAAWRCLWGMEFPFYIVQLANFMPRQAEPGDSLWAEMREAQRLCAAAIPGSGLAVTIDAGEEGDIHPADKRTVGERLARLALAGVYGEPVVASGPLLAGYAVEGARIRLRFTHAEGLRARGALEGFAVAGEDRVFRWAEARIEGETVFVSHPAVSAPVAVRYGWQDNPPCSLENAAGLPASPFRTDGWPLFSDAIRQ